MSDLPFDLPERPSVRQIRQQPTVPILGAAQTQPLAGFEPAGARIVEEWMLFDEVGVSFQAYRA